MPLNLVAPGTRKRNRYFLARGSINRQVYEFNTYTTDKKAALRVARELEDAIKTAAEPKGVPSGERITFAEAAQLYRQFRSPSTFDCQCIDRVVAQIGRLLIGKIRPVDLHDMAVKMYPNGTAATRNRNAMRPAITILHHAAGEGLCDWIRAKKFKEPPPATRAVSVETAGHLIDATKGPYRRLIVWLFYQGTRISATLRVQWEHIDLVRNVVMMDIRKGKSAREKPLHEETVAELWKVPKAERKGPVFPWRTRSGVRWLSDVMPGTRFTSHMARHTHGTQLNAQGAGLRTIMESLDHSDPKSSIRYQAADVEIVRAATGKIKLNRAASLAR